MNPSGSQPSQTSNQKNLNQFHSKKKQFIFLNFSMKIFSFNLTDQTKIKTEPKATAFSKENKNCNQTKTKFSRS